MDDLDPWPLAPILADLPATAQLTGRYDVDRLRADVESLSGQEWIGSQILSGDGVRPGADVDWRKLPLRSIGGDADRSDPGGPALKGFADTPWLGKAPYIADVLAGIPAPLRCVRLQSLGPGAASPLHNDTKYCLPWGVVRLHVPIVTTPGAVLHIGGEIHRWQVGELWYADFTRPHLICNTDRVRRIHLVIDCEPTRELLSLFPEVFRSIEVTTNTLFAVPEVPVPAAESPGYRCSFAMPRSFPLFDEAAGEFLTSPRTTAAEIGVLHDRLVLSLDGEPAFTLVHVGGGEFHFAGWTMERTLQVVREGTDGVTVVLRTRAGDRTWALTLPATSPDSSWDGPRPAYKG